MIRTMNLFDQIKSKVGEGSCREDLEAGEQPRGSGGSL